MILQATAQGVRLIDSASLTDISTWHAPEGTAVTMATSNLTQCAVALSSGGGGGGGGGMMGADDDEGGGAGGYAVVLLEIDVVARSLTERKRCEMENEVSCLNLEPLALPAATTTAAATAAATSGLSADPPADAMDTDEATGDAAPAREAADLLAVGTWTDHSVRLLSLPDLVHVTNQPLGSDTQVR